MGKKKCKRESFSDRAGFIVGMFREQPERKFTMKSLAAASGGADKSGRDMTKRILDTLLEQGYIQRVKEKAAIVYLAANLLIIKALLT